MNSVGQRREAAFYLDDARPRLFTPDHQHDSVDSTDGSFIAGEQLFVENVTNEVEFSRLTCHLLSSEGLQWNSHQSHRPGEKNHHTNDGIAESTIDVISKISLVIHDDEKWEHDERQNESCYRHGK